MRCVKIDYVKSYGIIGIKFVSKGRGFEGLYLSWDIYDFLWQRSQEMVFKVERIVDVRYRFIKDQVM